MPYSYIKLKKRIKDLYGSQVNFSNEIGLSKNAVSKKLRGKTEFSQSDVQQWAEVLGINKNEYGEFFYT